MMPGYALTLPVTCVALHPLFTHIPIHHDRFRYGPLYIDDYEQNLHVFRLAAPSDVLEWIDENTEGWIIPSYRWGMFDTLPPAIEVKFRNERDALLFKMFWL